MKSLAILFSIPLWGCATMNYEMVANDAATRLQELETQVLTDPDIDCTEARTLAKRLVRDACGLDDGDGTNCYGARLSYGNIRQECSRRFEQEHLPQPGYE
jgi:hypothetical protein